MASPHPLGDLMTILIKTNASEGNCMFDESRGVCGPDSTKSTLPGDDTNPGGPVQGSREVSDHQPVPPAESFELQRAADDGCPHHDD